MSGETNLDKLLQSMKPELRDGIFVFCTLPEDQGIPAGLKPVLYFREEEGATLILRRDEAEKAGLAFHYPSRMITLTVHSSLEAVGFLAAITTRLAASAISVNPVSAYFHDHLFIPEDRAADAMTALRGFSKPPVVPPVVPGGKVSP